MSEFDDWQVRPARPDDVPAVLDLVRALAIYEREPDAVTATEDDLRAALFGPAPAVFCHVVDTGSQRLAGMAIWFVSFSTWLGRHGIWLEDLFVRPEARGLGLGQALLRELAALCVDRGYARLEWNVLDWNTPALDFYRQLGANPLEDWTVHRLVGKDLLNVASRGVLPDPS